MLTEEKQCLRCQRLLPRNDFNKNRSRPDGLQAYCRDCQSVITKESYARDTSKSHNGLIRRKYGLSPEDYQAMLNEQRGVCAICRAPPAGKRLAVDHDHETGAVRGLLCKDCNVRLATIENLDFVSAANAYLERKQNDPS